MSACQFNGHDTDADTKSFHQYMFMVNLFNYKLGRSYDDKACAENDLRNVWKGNSKPLTENWVMINVSIKGSFESYI